MAGRHGVPTPERRSHARTAAGARRRRTATRDAAQPWAAWLALRGFLALLVLAAATWSVLLLTQSRGGIWPIIALAAGALSLAMIGLDIRARRRQRAVWRAEAGHSDPDPDLGSEVDQEPDPVTEWPQPGDVVAVDAMGGVQELEPQPVSAPEPAALTEPVPAPVLHPIADPPARPSIPELPTRRSHRK